MRDGRSRRGQAPTGPTAWPTDRRGMSGPGEHPSPRAPRRPGGRPSLRAVRRADVQEHRGYDTGQMMLLTAVLLVIGFVALAGIVARVNTVGSQTAAVRDNAVAQEAPQVARIVDELLAGLKENATDDLGIVHDDDAEFRANVTAAMGHLELLERSRGFRLDHTIVCDGGVGRIEVVLHDRTTRISFRSEDTFNDPSC